MSRRGSSPSAVVRSVLNAVYPDLDDRPRHHKWSAFWFLSYQRPVVYVQSRGGKVMYVGSGLGLYRPLSPTHHKLRVRRGDKIDLVWCHDLAQARRVEVLLIRALRPKLNGTPVGGGS